MNKTFIIYSSARSGSTTLMNILNTHQQIACLNEPFNPDHHHPFDVTQLNHFPFIQAQLQAWLADYNSIKHVWDVNGWPFVSRNAFNQRLLLEFYQVIFLNRRNVLQRVVSSQLSLQSQVWHMRSQADKENHNGFTFRALDLEAIDWQLKNEKKVLAAYIEFFKAHQISYTQLWYVSHSYKQNPQSLYRKVPDIDLIEKQFGSDQNGWLFRE
jgi:LPS sulfotransferase NodH